MKARAVEQLVEDAQADPAAAFNGRTERELRYFAERAGLRAFALPARTGTLYLLVPLSRKHRRPDAVVQARGLPAAFYACLAAMQARRASRGARRAARGRRGGS